MLDRTRVSFTYRDGRRRTLEPWGLTSSKGRWYVIGRDVDRDATRMFKLSRITDLPRRVSKAERVRGAGRPRPALAGPLARPQRADRRGRCSASGPAGRPACAAAASRVDPDPRAARRASRRSRVGYGELYAIAEEIGQYAADVVVLEPAELRDLVIAGLRAVAGAGAA